MYKFRCPKCNKIIDCRTPESSINRNCPNCSQALHITIPEENREQYFFYTTIRQSDDVFQRGDISVFPVAEARNSITNAKATQTDKVSTNPNGVANNAVSATTNEARPVLHTGNTIQKNNRPDTSLFLLIDRNSEKELNKKIATQYPVIIRFKPDEEGAALYFLKKALPDHLPMRCIISNHSDGLEDSDNKRLVIRVENSSFIQQHFGDDSIIRICGIGINDNKQLAINEIEVIHRLPIGPKDEAANCYLVLNKNVRHTNFYFNKLLSTIPMYSEGIEDELKQWEDYIHWKMALTQLKICSAKYIGRRISWDEEGYPCGIEFLVAAPDENEAKKYKTVFNRSRDEMAVYGNSVSKNRWVFSFNQDLKRKIDRGTSLPYLEHFDSPRPQSLVPAFEAYETYDLLRKSSEEFGNPVLFIAKFAFDPDDEMLYDRERQANPEERDFEEINYQVLRDIPSDGFISTTRVGDFALNRRLQYALNDLKSGKAVSPNLGNWIFDIKKAATADDEPQPDLLWSEWGEEHLNDDQKETIKKMLAAKEVFLCQGPPGTGKTTVIAEAVYQMVKRGQRVLIASQTNLAVNNALSVLIKNYPNIRAVRLGVDRKLDETVIPISEDNIVKTYFVNSARNLRKHYVDSWEYADGQLQEYNNELNLLASSGDELLKLENDPELQKLNRQMEELKIVQSKLIQADDVSEEDFKKLKTIKKEIKELSLKTADIQKQLEGKRENSVYSFSKKYKCSEYDLEEVISQKLRNLQLNYPQKAKKEEYGEIIFDYVHYVEKQNGDFELENSSYLRQYINSCNVVGVSCTESSLTLTQAGFNTFDVTIIDEVSKATPPELLIPMLLSQKVVLVGDHRQLPPLFGENIHSYEEYIENVDPEDEEAGKLMTTENYSLFKELVTNGLFKRHFEEADEKNKNSLLTQYRMHREIMEVINYFYSNQLKSGWSLTEEIENKEHFAKIKSVYGNTFPISPKHHAYWVDSSSFQGKDVFEKQVGSSKNNILEAKLIAKMVRDIDDSYDAAGYEGVLDIGIISFYGDQIKLIKRMLPDKKTLKHVVCDCNTVDRFQGKEKPIVLVSLVRNVSENKKKYIDPSFVNAYQRINVAFSRAQKLLIIVGAKNMYFDQLISMEDMNTGKMRDPECVYGKIIDSLNLKGCFLTADELLGPEYRGEIFNEKVGGNA